MTMYAYARVSSQDQCVARQLDAFAQMGIDEQNVFVDKQSGKDFEREQYARLLAVLKKDDLLVIKSIDRLGRNYDAIIEEWKAITREIGADIAVLDMPVLDTRERTDNLMGKFISDVVLQVLSFVAENERQNIRQRQKEGIASAKLRGVRFGRPQSRYSEQFVQVFALYFADKLTIAQVSEQLGLSRCNCYYHASKLRKMIAERDGETQSERDEQDEQ